MKKRDENRGIQFVHTNKGQICLKYSKWRRTTCYRNTCTVPCYSTVARLDVDSCVYDVTSHYVVGEVRFQDVEIGIDGNLEKIMTNKHSVWAALQVNCISMSREKLGKKIIMWHLQDIVSWRNVSDVDPLAVDVGSVDVMTSWTQSLRTHPETPHKFGLMLWLFRQLTSIFLQALQMSQIWV